MSNARRWGTPFLLFGAGTFLLTGADSCTTPENPKADTTQQDQAAQNSKSEAPAPAASKAAPPPAAANGQLNDKGWVLQSFRFSCDVLDQLDGSARITNTNS